MQKFVSNRDIVVRSAKAGMAIRFVKGEPQAVPRSMHDEVLEKGIMPVDGEGKSVDAASHKVETGDKPKVVIAPESAEEREDAIIEAIKAVVKRNEPKEFTGAGMPRADVVTKMLSWKVDQADVKKVWEKHRVELTKEARGE